MLHVLYLVHDLSDPAVRRRVIMMQAGGAIVTIAGFTRSREPISEIATIVPIDLGRTSDGRFTQRVAAVARAALTLGSRLKGVAKPDLIIGRNLEMLALANRAKAFFPGDVPIVYECLDIHRLLLRRDMTGKALRFVERTLSNNAQLLITSSPAFVRQYFAPFGQINLPVEVVENKVLELGPQETEAINRAGKSKDEAWKIGWFGALRCRTSLELLAAFSRKMEGRVEIVLRGRPAYSEFDDFDRFVANEPFMQFHGAYANPEDLQKIYDEVHFSWAIDFYEAGQNSNWLLPNRLYEGCRYGSVPIAMQGTETSLFLQERGIGFSLGEPTVEALAALFDKMDTDRYQRACEKVEAQERSAWVFDQNDCRALVERLGRLTHANEHGAALQVAA
ncbi:glycosyl transferase family 1 [Phyllobacterium bourgognense]|uniref:Succinoglycan biosynthesis protein ExoL n=1 Tax=Phyllobacterium bourgognense TaxID=314236 RepID=A0A368ZAB2_9HYPH|nr:glycosyl transferase family 1 [Phyllobacterium bourgognense]RCW87404.1 succinoglycan biosynthesis protein ExoL [Phyllobacterium bourgognense]